MIVAGGGVRASGAGAELVALAEALQIPVATSLNGKDAIPGNHPLSVGVVGSYSRESANRVVNGADLVCFIGTETGGMTTHFWAVPKIGTPAVQIDIDPEAIGRNYPLHAGVNGDAKVTLARMLRLRRSRQRRQAQGLGRGGADDLPGVVGEVQIGTGLRRGADPARAHVRASSPGTCRTTASSWSIPAMPACGWAACTTSPARRRAICAAPAISAGRSRPGLGAKCACPDRPVVTFTGDAGFWYHIAEIETAARWGINAVTVVNNNSSGNQSKRGFDRVYGGTQTERRAKCGPSARSISRASPRTWARSAFGSRSPPRSARAIQQALKANRPVVIDVVTDIDALAPLAVT